jgi:hypothetical protein
MTWHAAQTGFDFTAAMRRVCEDLTSRLPELAHIDVTRVAIAWSRARNGRAHGLQASLTPLRFAGGALQSLRGHRRWTLQRLFDPAGAEYLYILRFYLPRFLQQPLAEKLCTIVHELWHIGPAFDGDLRRFAGRCYAHSRSERDYDDLCRALVEKWLRLAPPAELYGWLADDFAALCRRHQRVTGQVIPAPKLIRL